MNQGEHPYQFIRLVLCYLDPVLTEVTLQYYLSLRILYLVITSITYDYFKSLCYVSVTLTVVKSTRAKYYYNCII